MVLGPRHRGGSSLPRQLARPGRRVQASAASAAHAASYSGAHEAVLSYLCSNRHNTRASPQPAGAAATSRTTRHTAGTAAAGQGDRGQAGHQQDDGAQCGHDYCAYVVPAQSPDQTIRQSRNSASDGSQQLPRDRSPDAVV